MYYSGHETKWRNGVAMTLQKDIAKYAKDAKCNIRNEYTVVLFFMTEMQNLKKTEEQGIIGRFRLGECNNSGNRLIEVCEDNYSGD